MAPGLLFSLLLLVFLPNRSSADSPTVCIIGSGIAGSSVAHFLRQYSPPSSIGAIRIFERHAVVGGRMATVTIGGETFEAGGSILHPRNYHALNFTKMLNLRIKGNSSSSDDDSFSLGIWDGHKFLFKTSDSKSKFPFVRKFFELTNSVRMFFRYGISLLRMSNFVEVITRINYGQSVRISGLAGAVSLAGSGGDLWAVEGGNWQMAAGLINRSDVTLHLHEEIGSITNLGEFYQLNSTKGNSYPLG